MTILLLRKIFEFFVLIISATLIGALPAYSQTELFQPRKSPFSLEEVVGLLDAHQKNEFVAELSRLIWASRCAEKCDTITFIRYQETYRLHFLSESGDDLGGKAPTLERYIQNMFEAALSDVKLEVEFEEEREGNIEAGQIYFEFSELKGAQVVGSTEFCNPKLNIVDSVLLDARVKILLSNKYIPATANCIVNSVSRIADLADEKLTAFLHQPLIPSYQFAIVKIMAEIRKRNIIKLSPEELRDVVQFVIFEIEGI